MLPIAGLTAWRALELGGLLLGSPCPGHRCRRRRRTPGRPAGQPRRRRRHRRRRTPRARAPASSSSAPSEVVVGIDAATGPLRRRSSSPWAAPRCARASEILAPEGVLVTYGRSSGEDGAIDPYWFGDHSGARIEGLLVFTEVGPATTRHRAARAHAAAHRRRPARPAGRRAPARGTTRCRWCRHCWTAASTARPSSSSTDRSRPRTLSDAAGRQAVAELVQAVVVDAEVVGDLVHDGDPHLAHRLVPVAGQRSVGPRKMVMWSGRTPL